MHPDFANPLEMLPIPKTATPMRGRGARGRCIWCGGEASLSLGPRLKVVDGVLHRWTPRGCEDCARREAAQRHRIHRSTCARCTRPWHCPDSIALHHLALGGPVGLIREG